MNGKDPEETKEQADRIRRLTNEKDAFQSKLYEEAARTEMTSKKYFENLEEKKQEIEQLNGQISELEDQAKRDLENLETENTRLIETNSLFKEVFDIQRESYNFLMGLLKESGERRGELEDDIAKKDVEIRRLERDTVNKDAEIRGLERDTESKDGVIHSYVRDIRGLYNTLRDYGEEKEKLQGEIDSLKEKVRGYETTRGEFENKYLKERNSLQTLTVHHSRLGDEKDRLEERIGEGVLIEGKPAKLIKRIGKLFGYGKKQEDPECSSR